MTISRKELPIYLLVAFVLPVAVWAQTDTVATNTASELVSESEWYTTERLSGDVTNGDFVVGPGRTELNLQPGDTETILISVANGTLLCLFSIDPGAAFDVGKDYFSMFKNY